MSKGWTALMLAAYNGFSECVELLLDNGAHPEVEKRAKKSDPGYTALCYACISGHAPCVRALVSRADECPLSAQAGDAALKLAKGGGHTECVRLLLDAGCEDPDAALADEALEANGVNKVTDKANAKATAKMKLLSKRKDESRPKMREGKDGRGLARVERQRKRFGDRSGWTCKSSRSRPFKCGRSAREHEL